MQNLVAVVILRIKEPGALLHLNLNCALLTCRICFESQSAPRTLASHTDSRTASPPPSITDALLPGDATVSFERKKCTSESRKQTDWMYFTPLCSYFAVVNERGVL